MTPLKMSKFSPIQLISLTSKGKGMTYDRSDRDANKFDVVILFADRTTIFWCHNKTTNIPYFNANKKIKNSLSMSSETLSDSCKM